jgi:hypothetical protein
MRLSDVNEMRTRIELCTTTAKFNEHSLADKGRDGRSDELLGVNSVR